LTICLAAFSASALTLFSGFGLGTLLLPVMAVFFPIDLAIALTAVVHALNNFFKCWLVGRHADRAVVLKFGLPAILAALLGARVLLYLSDLPPLLGYHLWGREVQVMPVKLVVAVLIAVFALFELTPRRAPLGLTPRYLPLGGVVSGFFGGLSGHQGALRSAFLIRAGLTKESFIATGVVISLMVDIPRIVMYGITMPGLGLEDNLMLLAAAILSAFAGAWLGSRWLARMTLRLVQVLVTLMLLAIAAALGSGLI
jgi:uncharacterized protein